MKFSTLTLLLFLFCSQLSAQDGTIEWVHLDDGANNGGCTSATNCDNGIICYGIQYTPPVTAGMTSYTFSYSGSCPASGVTFTQNASCVLDDNSQFNDGCAAAGVFRFFTSASGGGTVPLTANTPIILHQVCIDLSSLGSLQIDPDMFNPAEPYTVSLNLPDGSFGSDTPTFTGFLADDSDCATAVTCADAPLCSINFSANANRLTLPTNANNHINDGSSSDEADQITHQFDVYDEINEDCTQAGGLTDISVATRLINTYDAGDNSFIDPLGGSLHRIVQDANGLTGRIPLGADADSESSAGDIRGYEITVEFADHIGVRANQIEVLLNGINSPGAAFESASLTFLDNNRMAYSSATYIGYFNGANDLSGNCLTTTPQAPFTPRSTGGVVFADQNTVNLTDPCQPVSGSGGVNGITGVRAVAEAGLDPTDVVRGFTLRVFGEDVAALSNRDDGSSLDGDDSFRANGKSITDAQLVSSLFAVTINGCVFEPIALPVNWLDFTARKLETSTQLDWATAAEINHSHFTVEWSTDGRSFRSLGTVREPIETTIDGVRRYDFQHDNPANGVNYYRIRQHDFDGSTSLSVLRTIHFSGSVGGKVTLFPNPAQSELTVLLVTPVAAATEMVIFTTTGQRVQTQAVDAGTSVLALDVATLPTGVYMLQLGQRTQRFVKQ
ncbi:MAG: T9SS type A sorting domain-containing protein [Bacteroidota bacterium]